MLSNNVEALSDMRSDIQIITMGENHYLLIWTEYRRVVKLRSVEQKAGFELTAELNM